MWPEVFFPGYGWVEFEPTAGQAPLDRPLPPQDSTNPNLLAPLNSLRTEDGQNFAGRNQDIEGLINLTQEAPAGFQPLFLLPILGIFGKACPTARKIARGASSGSTQP